MKKLLIVTTELASDAGATAGDHVPGSALSGQSPTSNAQLIDAETGAHLRADRFEEDITDLSKLQDQVVAQLDAKAELNEARRLNPAITIKWMKEHSPNLPTVFDGLRKAGLPEE
jgi:hypothetical protein